MASTVSYHANPIKGSIYHPLKGRLVSNPSGEDRPHQQHNPVSSPHYHNTWKEKLSPFSPLHTYPKTEDAP